ncbi:acyloxyacyl hydrolase [Idiomarina seosinensis]|uniref:acyloxyacyl hydrolase n=1 Tax=Idiomarina seosinensis TaxID=281739 RepID=UPI00384D80CC
MKKVVFSTFLVLGSVPATLSAAEIHFAGAYSADQLRGARLSLRSDSFAPEWLNWAASPTLAFEGGLNHWQNSNDTADNITAFSVSPILSWQLTQSSRPLFFEAGIGVTYLDNTRIGDRNLSTHWHFEDRLGLAWQYNAESKARVSLAYTHHSNADIEKPNDGLDFFSLTWVLPF